MCLAKLSNVFLKYVGVFLKKNIVQNNKVVNKYYQRKKGSQQARKADMMIPNVLAAFLSLFILLLLVIGGSSGKVSGHDCPTEGNPANPADIPLICRCLFSKAAATLLLKHQKFFLQ